MKTITDKELIERLRKLNIFLTKELFLLENENKELIEKNRELTFKNKALEMKNPDIAKKLNRLYENAGFELF